MKSWEFTESRSDYSAGGGSQGGRGMDGESVNLTGSATVMRASESERLRA